MFGRRVLRGLTYEETREFEHLDDLPPFEGRLVWPPDQKPISPRDTRWFELYEKHRTATEN